MDTIKLLDGEFFEPISLGAEPVTVSADYFYENPYRYLVRYFNAVNWKDLILVEADSGLTYEDHFKLLRYTKNTSISTPGGKVFFNSTGNPGMATIIDASEDSSLQKSESVLRSENNSSNLILVSGIVVIPQCSDRGISD